MQQQHQQQHQRLMRQPSSSWFQGCPLSKFIAMTTIFMHIILEKGGFSGGSDLLSLNLEDIMTHSEFYRLFLSPLTFSSMGELVTGLMLLVPFMIQFEREMGTKKFGSFFFVKCFLLSTMLQLLSLILLDGFFTNGGQYSFYLSPGPYSLIGSLLYLYHVYTPRLYIKFIGILGFDFSEKFMTYFFTFITVYSQGLSSIIPTVCGFVASWISISPNNVYGQWECILPNFVHGLAHSVAKVFGLDQLVTTTVFLSRSTPRTSHNGRPARNVGGAPPPPPPAQPQFQPMPPSQPPSQESIEQLTAMGFERDAVVRALGATDNNVEAAANRLLSGI